MTLEVAAPLPLNGELLLQQLGAAGVSVERSAVFYDPPRGSLVFRGLGESSRAAVEAVIGQHAPTAQAEIDQADAERANGATLRDRAGQALQTNRDFLALASPTNAQTLAQVKALTRQNNGLIRLVLNRFDGTD